MLKRLMERRREEEGFTLIELMVVVLIIGILIAIALPTFLGARQRAQNRAAQSDLRNAVAAAKTLYTDRDSYNPPTGSSIEAQLAAIEPSLTFVAAGTAADETPTNEVSVAVGNVAAGDGQVFAAAAMSASGTCFTLKDVAASGGSGAGNTPGTWYGSTTTAANCTGTWALANTSGTSW